MFTGIIETIGEVVRVENDKTNVHFTVQSKISAQLKIDQSVSHQGVCLTVIDIKEDCHTVTAIKETLDKSNLNDWKTGTLINLERCTQLGERLDGHIVQGHVDTTAKCIKKEELNGSWKFTFKGENQQIEKLTVDKGSISINGVSLTIVQSEKDQFSVAIIPYTFENTTFHQIEEGSEVNIEFDIVGKYVSKMMKLR